MTANEIQIRIRGGAAISVSVEGLSELEISAIAGQVEEKIKSIEEQTKIVDTSKLVRMAAFAFATDLYNLQHKSDINNEAQEKKLEELIDRLEKVADKK